MNWAQFPNIPRGGGCMLSAPAGVLPAPGGVLSAPVCCGTKQETQAKPSLHRTLSDITNITAQGNGLQSNSKRPLVEAKVPPFRHSKSGSDCSFAIFEDGTEDPHGSPKRPAAPLQARPNTKDGEQDCYSGHQMFGIQEAVEAELPPIQDFAGRVTEQDCYQQVFGFDNDPDGFGRPEDLARILSERTDRARIEAEATSTLRWGSGTAENGVDDVSSDSLDSHELNMMAWRSLSPSPKRDPDSLGVNGLAAASSSPLLPPLSAMDLDIDSGEDGDLDGHYSSASVRRMPFGDPMTF